MRILTGFLCAAAVLFLISGCQGKLAKEAPKGKKELLSVDFKQGQTLRYKQASQKDIKLDFDPAHKVSKADSGSVQDIQEHLEMIVAFKAIKVDESGFVTIEQTFEKVNPWRTSVTGHSAAAKEPVNYLQGKSIRLEVSPSGIITDPCGFSSMVAELGKQAFGGKGMGVKDPDMIQDFVALERMMWDAVSSVEHPAQGVAIGQKWKSLLMAPMPMPVRVGADTTYKLADVEEVNGIRIADIESASTLSDKRLETSKWPLPYVGSFQMRGTFGFLSGYKVLSLQGKGRQKYDLTNGRVQKIEQQFETNVSAQMPFGLGGGESPSPNLFVKQNISIELLAQ